MSNQPIILLTFAKNDLKNVSTEAEQLRHIVAQQSQIECRSQEDLTAISLNQAVSACGNRLLMYHFSGHASPSVLELDDFQKLETVEFSRILKHGQEKLAFVFLNGCRSYGHIAQLTAKGVKAFIVSNTSIGDKMAMKLASEFYDLFLLKGYTLKGAFEAASAATVKGYKPNPIIVNPGEPDVVALSYAQWVLVIHSDYQEVLNWKLQDFINPPKKNEIPRLLTGNAGNPSYFLGRETDLAAISAAFSESLQPLFLVNGEGGIGKTTLAARYWHLEQKNYKHLGWLNAALGVKDAFLSLAHPLGIRFEPQDSSEIQIQKVSHKLMRLDNPILLVFDNADDVKDLENCFMVLQSLTNCHILVTTRIHQLADARVHRVEPLHETEALKLFAHHYKPLIDNELSLLKNIFEAVGYNTLVIELLAKNLKVLNRFQSNVYPIARLLEDLQTKGLLALVTKDVEITYQTPILRKAKPEEIIRAMYDLHPLSEESLYLLSNFSVLPSVAIPFGTLYELLLPPVIYYNETFEKKSELHQTEDKESIEMELTDLQQKGWIRFDENEDGFKVSPVIQAIVRNKQKATLFENCRVLMKNLTAKLSIDETKNNPVDKFAWVPVGEAVAHHFDECTSPNFPMLQTNLAARLINLGNYLEAKRLFEKVMHTYELTLGQSHPSTAVAYSNLALVLYDLGEYAEAKPLLEKAMHYNKANFGEQHPTTAITYSNLATVLHSLGDYYGAKQLLEKAIDCDEANFGEMHHTTMVSYSNLALLLRTLGNYQEAKQLLEKVKHFNKANFGEIHPTTILSYSNLATVLYDLGEYVEAKLLLEKAARSNEGNFGEMHPTTALSYSNLALVLKNLGNDSEARQLLIKVIHSNEANLGKTHPATVMNYSNLAVILYDLGEYSEAKRLLEEAILSDEATFGEMHPIMAQRYSNLGMLLKKLGDYSEAKQLLEKAYRICHNHLGAAHPNTKTIKSNLGDISYALIVANFKAKFYHHPKHMLSHWLQKAFKRR